MTRPGSSLALFTLLLLGHAVPALASPASAPQRPLQQQQAAQSHGQTPSGKLKGRFLHLTDIHADELYKPYSSTDKACACHRGHGQAGSYGAETTDCDSPVALADATLQWIEANVKDEIDFVVWTGDSARHDSDDAHPRSEDQVLGANRAVADKLVDTFSRDGRLSVPIVPTLGNNDVLPHNILYPGPNKWLRAYSDIWKSFIPEEQRHTFRFGGWFYVEVVPARLAAFSLNTMYFFDRNAAVNGCADPSEQGFKHMEWLSIQLQHLRERGMKAILIGHVPPARTKGKTNWDETCWQKYTLWLQQFRDVVTGAVYGHMNIDHFLLQDTKEIDVSLAVNTEPSGEKQLSAQSKQDYLQDLRDEWGDLPDAALRALEDLGNEDAAPVSAKQDEVTMMKKGKNLKKIGGKYAERYQLSLVSPSVVPNYFPTIRVIEYNISGLEDATVWRDAPDLPIQPARGPQVKRHHEDAQQKSPLDMRSGFGTDEKKKKKKKKGKGRQPSDPNLVIPEDPEKKALPGPAYHPQPFSFVGYTQYFANLTHINGHRENSFDGSLGQGSERIRKHTEPRKFKYEVEYSTFDDDVYKLKDMTVKSYLKLAYRIGEHNGARMGSAHATGAASVDDVGTGHVEQRPPKQHQQDVSRKNVDAKSSTAEPEQKKVKNEVWLHFLGHAFVGTMSKEELEEL